MDHQDTFRGCMGQQGKNYFHNITKTPPFPNCVDVCFDGVKANIGKKLIVPNHNQGRGTKLY